MIGHFQDTPDIAGLVLIEKKIRFGRIAIYSIQAFQHSQADENIRKVPGALWMQAHAPLKRIQILGALGQFRKKLQLDRAQQSLRGPEAHTELHDFSGEGVDSIII